MADKKISELALRATVLPTDQFANSADNVTWRSPVSAITSLITAEAYIDYVGSPVSGDWTTVFQTAAASGKVYRLRSDTTYALTSKIDCTIGGFGLIGPRSAKIYLPATWGVLDLTSPAQTGALASVFHMHPTVLNADAPLGSFTFQGFTVESAPTGGRHLNVFFGRALDNVTIEDVEIYGVPCGKGIRLSTISNSRICRNYIHDFLISTPAAFSQQPQTSGIAIDEERVDGAVSNKNSTDVLISENLVRDLDITGQTTPAWNHQTDGINLQGSGQESRIVVADNIIRRVGDGIDNFADRVIVANNQIDRCTIGMKMIHGASYCSYNENIVTNAALYSISIVGGALKATSHNSMLANVCLGVDPDNTAAGGNTACIGIFPGAAFEPADNFIADNYLDPTYGGGFGKWAVIKIPSYNYFRRNRGVAGASGWELELTSPTLYHTYRIQPDPLIESSWEARPDAADPANGAFDRLNIPPEINALVFVGQNTVNTDDWIRLPPARAGKVIRGWSGVAHELRTPAGSNALINGVDADGTNEAAIVAVTYWEATCVSDTRWILRAWDATGAARAAIIPDP